MTGVTDALLRAVALALGSLGLIAFFRSIVRKGWLNTQQLDVLSTIVGRIVVAAFAWRVRRRRRFRDVQKLMAWAFPVYSIGLVALWFVLVQFSFALIIRAVEAEHTFLEAFIASGSALATLGFDAPSTTAGRFIAILEGAVGLGIIVFLFTFIPGYQAAVQARENKVGWLYARNEGNPTGLGLIRWFSRAGQGHDLTPLWKTGEAWFRGIFETHAVMPFLAFVPSIYEGTWIHAAETLLDATSFAISSIDAPHVTSARVCRAIGLDTLRAIASGLARSSGTPPATGNAETLAAAYDAAFNELAAGGTPVKPDRDQSRRAFLELRAEYDGLVAGIARATLMDG